MKQSHSHKQYKRIIFLLLLVMLLFFSIGMIFFIDAQALVQNVGIENTYGIMFLLTLVSGLSSFGAGIIYTTLITFIKGGAIPIWLGIATGVGMGLGDLFFYFVFSRGHDALPERVQKRVTSLSHFLEHKDPKIIPVFILLWTIFTPFPNDIMCFTVSILGYPFKKAWAFILIGDIVHMIGLSLLIGQGILLI